MAKTETGRKRKEGQKSKKEKNLKEVRTKITLIKLKRWSQLPACPEKKKDYNRRSRWHLCGIIM